jgi:hypothetical protein
MAREAVREVVANLFRKHHRKKINKNCNKKIVKYSSINSITAVFCIISSKMALTFNSV